MKIKYLGTAAAEGIPAVFCNCALCKRSRALGGKNVRTRSQALIDDRLLVDFSGDTYMHSLVQGIELSEIKSCLITHSHFDHLYTAELWCRSVGIAHEVSSPLTFYGTDGVIAKLAERVATDKLDEAGRVALSRVEPFVPFEVEGYRVTPLRAHHDPASDPVIYIVEKDGKSLLYANDTGFFPDETLDYLKKSRPHFDLVSIDCTGGTISNEKYGRSGHLNLIGDEKMCELMRSFGNVDDGTVIVVNHFSHNGVPCHDELVAAAAKYGFIVAYDGMEIEF